MQIKIHSIIGGGEAAGCHRPPVDILPASSRIGLRLTSLGTATCYAVVLLIATLIAPAVCQGDRGNPLKVGVGMVEITPPIGFPHYREELAGNITGSTGIKDPLYAKALVFKQGDIQGALLMCDLNSIPRDLSRLVREHASKQTGIPFQHISIAATHTHTGPSIRGTIPGHADRLVAGELTEDDQEGYIANLIRGMTEAIVTASRQAQEIELTTGVGHATGISFNRRFLMTNGRVRFNPGYLNPQIVRPVGPVDSAVHFILFRPIAQAAFCASLTVFANHTDTEGGIETSADYPFYLQERVREIFGEQIVSIFGAGACGDINHIDVSRPGGATEKHVITERIGKELAEAIKEALPNGEQRSSDLSVASRTLYLPLQDFTNTELQWAKEDTNQLYPERSFMENVRRIKILSLEQLRQREAIPPSASEEPWLLPVEIHVFRLDTQTAIVTMPGEIFAELGIDLKERSPFANTMLIELANADIRYVPTRRAFAEGDYEPLNSRLAPGSGEKMVEEALYMLHNMAP